MQVKGMMELEWKRSDVFRNSGRAKTLRLLNVLSMQLPINLLHESASISALSLCSTRNMVLSWNLVENRAGRISRVN